MILFYVNGGTPCLLYSEFWDFLGGKLAGAWCLPPTSF